MSGGSLDYIGSKLATGDVTGAMRYWQEVIAWIERAAAVASTPEEAIALAALLENARRLERDMQSLAARLPAFAEVGAVADRVGSSDDGLDRLAAAAVRWMRSCLGMPTT